MESARRIDWYEEFGNNPDRWVNHGRNILEDSCTHTTQDKGKDPETNVRYSGWCEECDFQEDSCQPMMNFGYPLRGLPSEEQILSVVKDTCLTIMEDSQNDGYFLVLCGGGMDLSQSIALAYLRVGERIPDDLVLEVCTQPALSVSKEEYREIMQACLEELGSLSVRATYRIERIKEELSNMDKVKA